MNNTNWLQFPFFIVVLLLLVKPLGLHGTRLSRRKNFLSPVFSPVERFFYRFAGVKSEDEMNWKTYAITVLLFNLVGFLFLYLLLRFQHSLPFNPQGFRNLSPDLSFNTAVSFVTNTNWQSYGGETTLSYLSQMLGLGVQNFLSAATGMSVLIALFVEFPATNSDKLGNFWVDLTRSTLYILLPWHSFCHDPGVAGCCADLSTLCRHPNSGSNLRCNLRKHYPSDRQHHRSRSNNWEQMAVVFLMSIQPIHLKTPLHSPIFWKCCRFCLSRLL